jgi:hypothetical protein
MLRVAGTYRAYGSEYYNWKCDLFNWTEEILDAMYANNSLANTALFHNYVDQDSTFLDASSTAAIAAATYHLAVLRDVNGSSSDRLNNAERARHELSFGGHIDGDGWLSPVVDPNNFPKEGSHSAEGQAFVVSMYAGYREWWDAKKLVAEESGIKESGTEKPGTDTLGAEKLGSGALGAETPSAAVPSADALGAKEPSASSASHASVSAGAIAALAALACIHASALLAA